MRHRAARLSPALRLLRCLPMLWATAAAAMTPASQLQGLASQWWRQTDDEGLQQWVAVVLSRHPETQQGALRLAAAQLRLQQAEQGLLPRLDATVQGQRTAAHGDTPAQTTYTAQVGVTHTVDLWGADRRRVQAESLAQQASVAQEQAQQVLVSTAAAQAYWQRAFGLAAWRQASEALHEASQVLQLVTLQQRVGKVSTLELAQAQAAVEEQRLREQALKLALSLNRLAALEMLGCTDASGDEADAPDPPLPLQAQAAHEANEALSCPPALRALGPAAPVPTAPPEAPPPATQTAPGPQALHAVGLSALLQRPDLHAAALNVQRLASEQAATDRAFLPTLRIGLSLSQMGLSLAEAVRNPLATLVASLSQMEARWGQRETAVALANNARQQALLRYQAALRAALLAVQAVTLRHSALLAEAAVLQDLLSHKQETERVYALRYRVGAVDLRSWLEAKEQRRAALNAVLDNRLAQRLNHLDWWLAIGAGPTPTEAPTP